MYNKICKLFLSATWLLMFSCADDMGKDTPLYSTDPAGKTEQDVMFRLAAPGDSEAPQTRAIGAYQENRIDAVNVLSFKVNEENNTETFDYAVEATEIPEENNGKNEQTFKMIARAKTYKQRFVIITNASSEVAGVLARIQQGAEKKDVLPLLEVSLPKGEKWNAVSGADFRPFPLWGESTPQVISQSTEKLKGGRIPLLRMVAKIDVVLNDKNGKDPEGRDVFAKFRLKSVYLYNVMSKGRIVPRTDDGYFQSDTYTALKPSVPEDAKKWGPDSKLEYRGDTNFAKPEDVDKAIRGVVYTFESEAANMPEATCIVVGGVYDENNDGFDNDRETYYRLDFLENDKITYRSILRNYSYIVNIVDVRGPGRDTPDEAFESKGLNMEVDILDWNDGEYGNVVFDGENHVSMERKEAHLSRKAGSKDEIGIQSDLLFDDFSLKFKTDTNGAGEEIKADGKVVGVRNNRFSVELIKKDDKEIAGIRFTALGDYLPLSSSGNKDVVVMKAGRLRIEITIDQLGDDSVDWDLGGDEGIDLEN